MFLDSFLAVGSANPDNAKAEVFEFGTGTWMTISDYPYSSDSVINDYEMIYIPELLSFLVIGGHDSGDRSIHTSQVAMLTNGIWTDAGHLNMGRVVSFFC